jgi:hypothetical protein
VTTTCRQQDDDLWEGSEAYADPGVLEATVTIVGVPRRAVGSSACQRPAVKSGVGRVGDGAPAQ